MTPGPPPLSPFGLVLHRDGRWTHEGIPIRNRKLREAFDRSVRYLPDEDKYVVQLGRYRGQIEPEEAAFFVTAFDPATGMLRLSDRTEERLDVASLCLSLPDGALLCRVKGDLAVGGLLARFVQGAQADLLAAVEETSDGPSLRIAGDRIALPPEAL